MIRKFNEINDSIEGKSKAAVLPATLEGLV
jgi:hypothetical protein